MKDLHSQEVLLQGLVRNGLYVLPTDDADVTLPPRHAFIGEQTSPNIWHARLGHPSPWITSFTIRHHNLPVTSTSTLSPCSACLQAKSHALPHPLSPSSSQFPFQLLFLDVWGPAPVLSSSGFRFYFSIVDDFTKYVWFFPLYAKSDVSQIFLNFVTFVRNTFSKNIIAVQSDWGGEFRPFHAILQKLGISHRISCSYSHVQNGSIERRHRHIVETGLSLLAQSSAPLKYWVDAFKTAVFLINRMPTHSSTFHSFSICF